MNFEHVSSDGGRDFSSRGEVRSGVPTPFAAARISDPAPGLAPDRAPDLTKDSGTPSEGGLSWAGQFLIPSVRDVIFIFLFWSLLGGALSNRPLADPDIGWHIRTGELMLATHTLPRTDPFSSTMHGQAWFAWEWLYDFALGILHRACGLNGVVWLCAVIVAATFTILLSQLLRRGTGLLLAIVLMLLAEAAATIHLFARPHIVSWLFTLAWFGVLERGGDTGCRTHRVRGDLSDDVWDSHPRWLFWFFPVSTVLWVNLHGGWLIGFALLVIYVFAATFEWLRASDAFAALRAARRARTLAWAGLTSAAATLVNPFGWHLHEHIAEYLGDRYLMNRISEFRSPDFHGWAQRCFVIILLLTFVAFAGHRRKLRLSHLLIVLLAVYTGLFSSRNLPVSSMLLVLVIGPVLWESFVSLAGRPSAWTPLRASAGRIVEFSNRMGAQELRLRGHLWPAAGTVLALASCLHGGWLGSRHLIDAHFDPQKVPAAAVDFLQTETSHTPVFSTDSWGGYLIYRLYPSRLVVLDDRHDLYGSGRIRDMLILMQGEPGWRDVLKNWQIQTVLLSPDSTLAGLLRELPQDWRVAYEDKVGVIFERR